MYENFKGILHTPLQIRPHKRKAERFSKQSTQRIWKQTLLSISQIIKVYLSQWHLPNKDKHTLLNSTVCMNSFSLVSLFFPLLASAFLWETAPITAHWQFKQQFWRRIPSLLNLLSSVMPFVFLLCPTSPLPNLFCLLQ